MLFLREEEKSEKIQICDVVTYLASVHFILYVVVQSEAVCAAKQAEISMPHLQGISKSHGH